MKKYLLTTMNGMTFGLFSTLIISVILKQIGDLLSLDFLSVQLYNTLSTMMGVGIGVGIGLSLKKDGLKLLAALIAGGVATSFKIDGAPSIVVGLNNNPVVAYLVVVLTLTVHDLILSKKTPFDVILIPLVAVLLAFGFTALLSYPINYMVSLISKFIDQATTYAPFIMVIIISVLMGIVLTSPISSVAVAVSIQISGIAAGAAVVGTTVQMIGFAVQSRKDNRFGTLVSIGLGTSMLQFKNILKKPIIWLPTIIASGILAPIMYLIFGIESSSYGAGMGSSGLVGPLQTLETMSYSTKAWFAILVLILGSIILTWAIDLLFRKKGLISTGDLKIDSNF